MLSRSAKLRLGISYWASAAAIFGIVGWSTVTVVGMQNDLKQAEKDRSALSQQVKDLGGTPVAGPRGSTGRDGRDGDTGPTGATGASGRDGQTGAAGSNGTDGKDGSDGKPGADGKPGTDGRDGVDGAQGPQGEKGDPGPTCPEGYEPDYTTYMFKQVIICTKSETIR